MKIQSTAAVLALALASTVAGVQAQDADRPERRQRPQHPVVAALDTNKDGDIDEKELAAAATALKALDKNSDGKLTRDEIAPPRREGRGNREGRRGGNNAQ
ncbi:MAG: EF-hand domain-containing protein [Chthoniobacteraceae bacterium]